MSAILKFNYVRSKSLMEAYRTIPCQNCGMDDGTVAGAHSNSHIHGKGRGLKASDEFCASLCVKCHYLLDDDKLLSRDYRVEMWNKAHKKTKDLLNKKGIYIWR